MLQIISHWKIILTLCVCLLLFRSLSFQSNRIDHRNNLRFCSSARFSLQIFAVSQKTKGRKDEETHAQSTVDKRACCSQPTLAATNGVSASFCTRESGVVCAGKSEIAKGWASRPEGRVSTVFQEIEVYDRLAEPSAPEGRHLLREEGGRTRTREWEKVARGVFRCQLRHRKFNTRFTLYIVSVIRSRVKLDSANRYTPNQPRGSFVFFFSDFDARSLSLGRRVSTLGRMHVDLLEGLSPEGENLSRTRLFLSREILLRQFRSTALKHEMNTMPGSRGTPRFNLDTRGEHSFVVKSSATLIASSRIFVREKSSPRPPLGNMSLS